MSRELRMSLAVSVLIGAGLFTCPASAEESQRVKNVRDEFAKAQLELELSTLPIRIEGRSISQEDAIAILWDAVDAGLITEEQVKAASGKTEKILACLDSQLPEEIKHKDYQYMTPGNAAQAAANTTFQRCTPRDLDIAAQVWLANAKVGVFEYFQDKLG